MRSSFCFEVSIRSPCGPACQPVQIMNSLSCSICVPQALTTQHVVWSRRAEGRGFSDLRCRGLNRYRRGAGVWTRNDPLAAAAGASTGRTIRQSARANSATSELSWEARGLTTRSPAGGPMRDRPHVVLAGTVSVDCVPEHRFLCPLLGRIDAEQTPQHRHQEHDVRRRSRRQDYPEAPARVDSPSGHRASACPDAWRSSRNRARGPRSEARPPTRSRSPTEAPPMVTRISAALPARARVTKALDIVLGDAEAHGSPPSASTSAATP